MRLLIVEDESALCQQLQEYFEINGFAVDVAQDATMGLYLGTEYDFDVAIIDIGLPDFSGVSLIKQLREKTIKFPILILTARSRWQEKVEGLEAGADDYLVKPFHFEELSARINALIRRSQGNAHPVMTHGPISLNTASQEIYFDSKSIEVTAYEYKVLEYLMVHKGEVISKAELTEHIYDQDYDRDSNVIEVFVGRLRKKLDPDGSLNLIETLRGRGYRIAELP